MQPVPVLLFSETAQRLPYIQFKDYWGTKCSLQLSTHLGDKPDFCWLGLEETVMCICDDDMPIRSYQPPKGVQTNSRMYLSRDHIRALLPYLKEFADTGHINLNKATA